MGNSTLLSYTCGWTWVQGNLSTMTTPRLNARLKKRNQRTKLPTAFLDSAWSWVRLNRVNNICFRLCWCSLQRSAKCQVLLSFLYSPRELIAYHWLPLPYIHVHFLCKGDSTCGNGCVKKSLLYRFLTAPLCAAPADCLGQSQKEWH